MHNPNPLSCARQRGNRIREDIRKVIKTLKDNQHDTFMILQFLATRNNRLQGRTPFEAIINGDTEEVTKLASIYGEQGAI